MKHNFTILDRNYTKKWGEIDVVSIKNNKIYFVEVKSVSRETSRGTPRDETENGWRPEDNMHPWKLKRLSRVIQTYLMSNKNLIVGELNNNPMPKSRLIDIVQGINYDNFGMSSIKSIEEALAELKNSLQIVYVASNDSADPTIYLTSQYGKLKQKQVS